MQKQLSVPQAPCCARSYKFISIFQQCCEEECGEAYSGLRLSRVVPTYQIFIIFSWKFCFSQMNSRMSAEDEGICDM